MAELTQTLYREFCAATHDTTIRKLHQRAARRGPQGRVSPMVWNTIIQQAIEAYIQLRRTGWRPLNPEARSFMPRSAATPSPPPLAEPSPAVDSARSSPPEPSTPPRQCPWLSHTIVAPATPGPSVSLLRPGTRLTPLRTPPFLPVNLNPQQDYRSPWCEPKQSLAALQPVPVLPQPSGTLCELVAMSEKDEGPPKRGTFGAIGDGRQRLDPNADYSWVDRLVNSQG
ncbi:hypothetical protein MMC13_007152 [Lambiella insularis]|nr:hypothetical protein [Lambiella insularis]